VIDLQIIGAVNLTEEISDGLHRNQIQHFYPDISCSMLKINRIYVDVF
jgi:hypothetical protein